MTNRTICAGIALGIVLLFSSIAIAQGYQIRLSRPDIAGNKYRLSATGRQSEKSTATVGSSVVKSENDEFSIELVSDVTVLETSKKGNAKKESISIEKCVLTDGETIKSLIPKGTIVVASVEDKERVFNINGKLVDPEIHKALSLVSRLSTRAGEPSDDDIFGTQENKIVGESWGINAELVAKGFQEINLIASKDNIKGAATLENVVKVGQENCLLITTWIRIGQISLPLPAEFKVEKGELQARFSGKFPINTSIGPLEQTQTMIMSVTANGKPNSNGQEVKIDVAYEMSVTYKITYLK